MNNETDPKPTPNATPTEMPKLRLKQKRFVEAYLGAAAGNGTEAARIAGYAGVASVLSAIASENLQKPQIQAALAVRQAELDRTSEYNVEQWRKDCIRAFEDARDANDRVATMQALKLLGLHVGSFEKDNAQKTPKPVGVIVFGPQTAGALPQSVSPALSAAPEPPVIDAEVVTTEPAKPEAQSPNVSTTV